MKKQEPAKLAAHTYNTTATEDVVVSYKPDNDTFPEEPIGTRLIVEPVDQDSGPNLTKVESQIVGGTAMYKKKGSDVLLTEEQANEVKKEYEYKMMKTPHFAVIKAVGNITIPVEVGDMVRVYLNQFEAPMEIEGKAYLIYQERSILSKVI